MARIVYCHPRQTHYGYHIYTDLDFWDTRRLLKDLVVAQQVTVKRNFGKFLDGDEFPTQVVADHLGHATVRGIETRLGKAIIAPPRHVIVRSMIYDGHFEFDPLAYYPQHWHKHQMLRFTHSRLPLQQSALCTPYKTVRLFWTGNRIRVEQVLREKEYNPVIRTLKEHRAHFIVPSCF